MRRSPRGGGGYQPMGKRHRATGHAVAHTETRRRSSSDPRLPRAGRSGAGLPSFPAILGVLDVLVQAPKPAPALFLVSFSVLSFFYLRTQETEGRPPSSSIQGLAIKPPWIPNPLRPKLLHLPSVLPNPSNHSPDPHLAGNRRFPVCRRAGTPEIHLHVDDLPSAPLCSN